MNDPHDNCEHWAGRVSSLVCADCEETLDDVGTDKLDPTRCSDCAEQNRTENDLSPCCSADLLNVLKAWSETEGYIYADHHTCENCGGRVDS